MKSRLVKTIATFIIFILLGLFTSSNLNLIKTAQAVVAIVFQSNDQPSTIWGVRAYYYRNNTGNVLVPPATYWAEDGSGLNTLIWSGNAGNNDYVHWYTACVDPSTPVRPIDIPFIGFGIQGIDVTCDSSRTNTIKYRGCGDPLGHGWVGPNQVCPANTSDDCVGRGLVDLCDTDAPNYCGGSTNATRCNTYNQRCNYSNPPASWCATNLVNTNVDRCRTPVNINGCQCWLGSHCGPAACGTAWNNKCSWVANRCNTNTHRCYEDTVNARDSRCVAATNTGTTGDICYNNSQCRTSTHYCRSLSSGPCGVCRPYDELQGRVFVDRNRDNGWDNGLDEGLNNFRVQRAPTGTNNWRTSNYWEQRTNPNGWFRWGPEFRLRDINNQDIRIMPWTFDMYHDNNPANMPEYCLYTNIIRSRYGGLGTVEASSRAGEPGHRRNNVDAEPNPTSVLFMLRHRPYEIRGRVYLDDGDGVFSAGDIWLSNPQNIRVRTLDPDGSGNSGDWLSSTSWYRLPDAANSPPPQRFYVYGRTYQVELVESTLPPNYEVLGHRTSDGTENYGVGTNFMDVTIDPPANSCVSSNWDNGNNFLVGRVYTAQGYLFNDLNGDGDLDAADGETRLANIPVAVSSDFDPANTVGTNASGNYTLGRLPAGPRTINLAYTIPSGWEATYPRSLAPATPPSAQITLGANPPSTWTCDVTAFNTGIAGANPAACIPVGIGDPNEGSATGITFGLREIPPDPWLQGIGGDMRADSPLTVNIPTGSTNPSLVPYFSIGNASGTLEPGIVFGNGLSLIDFENSAAGTQNSALSNTDSQYVARDYAQNTVKMSYPFISNNLSRNGITPSALNCPNPSNCNIRAVLSGAGGTFSSGNLTIGDAASPPNDLVFDQGDDYIILVNGDLTINDNILVNPGTTLFFIVSGSITVDVSVENLHGVYSAGGQFIVNGSHVLGGPPAPPDTPIAIQGSVIAGGLTNLRDLDFDNDNFPPLSIEFRPDFVLNAPVIVRFQNYKITEVAPGDKTE